VIGVGKYRYIAMLAEGGMADVYLAVTQSAGFEKLVVIKQLRDSLAEDPSFVAMFMDEARLAARLNHPNVVQTLEVGTDLVTGLHFIAMEFLEGVAHVRFARLKERVPPPLAFGLRILVDVLRGLHYAHELRDFDGKPLNVVHRDVSPQNVMLTFAGGVKILDFGIAKAALAAEQRPEDFKGKLEYMAPEQALMEDVDRRADVFSVGVMLFEALTRRRLYRKGEDKLQLLVDGQLPDVLEVAPGTPKRLAAICAKAMAHDRDARYPTADAMADDLEEYLGSTTQHVSARDVGSYVAEKFASTRAKISSAVEAQLALFRSLPESAPDTIPLSRIPVTDLPPPDFSDPPPPVAFGSGSHGSIGPGGMFPHPFPSTASIPNGWATSETASAVNTIPPHMTARPAPRGMTGPIIAIAALMAVALLSGVVAIASTRRKAAASAAELAATSAPTVIATATGAPGAAAPEEAQIDFTIKASPPEARISVDGKPLGSNPASGKRPRDGAMHVLRIEAPGHEPREESIAFDRSLLINIELHAIAAQRSGPSAGGDEAPGPSATSRSGRSTRGRPAPRPHGPNGKALDPENPYQ
jgi:serine/threonine-protein kinase